MCGVFFINFFKCIKLKLKVYTSIISTEAKLPQFGRCPNTYGLKCICLIAHPEFKLCTEIFSEVCQVSKMTVVCFLQYKTQSFTSTIFS